MGRAVDPIPLTTGIFLPSPLKPSDLYHLGMVVADLAEAMLPTSSWLKLCPARCGMAPEPELHNIRYFAAARGRDR